MYHEEWEQCEPGSDDLVRKKGLTKNEGIHVVALELAENICDVYWIQRPSFPLFRL